MSIIAWARPAKHAVPELVLCPGRAGQGYQFTPITHDFVSVDTYNRVWIGGVGRAHNSHQQVDKLRCTCSRGFLDSGMKLNTNELDTYTN